MGGPIKEGSKCITVSDTPRVPTESSARMSWWHQTHGNWKECWICSGTNFIGQEWLRMWNFTLQSVSNPFNSKVNPKWQQWRISKLPTHYSWCNLDYLTIEMTEGGKNVQVLIITDHLMMYAQVLVTSLQTAKCTVQALWNQFVVYYQHVEHDLISELCKFAKVQRLCTSLYHPQPNGQCIWFNSILINMLGTLPPNKKSSWRDMVPTLVHVSNCTRGTATGFPSILSIVWSKKPQHLVNLYFGTQKADMHAATGTKFVQHLCKRLKWAYKTAQHVIEKENQKHMWKYDLKIRCT